MALLLLPSDILRLINNLLDIPSKYTYSLASSRLYKLFAITNNPHLHVFSVNCMKLDYLNLLQWIRVKSPASFNQVTIITAASLGNLRVVQWLGLSISIDVNCITTLYYNAVTGNNVELVKFIFGYIDTDAGTLNHAPIINMAIEKENLEMVKFLRLKGFAWDHRACDIALTLNYYDILRWLRSQIPPCPWTEETRIRAEELGIY